MFHHISVGVRDVARAATFYDAVLGALGYKRVMEFLPHAIGYGDKQPSFWIQLPRGQQEMTSGNGAHVSFAGFSKAAIESFHAVALTHGGADDGAPGARPDYGPDYFGAFIIDPDGNRLEATLMAKPVAPKAAARPKVKKAKTVKKAKKVKQAAKPMPAQKVAKKAAKKAKKPAKQEKAGKKKGKKGKKGKKK